MKLGEQALAGGEPARVPSGVRLILEDVAAHPDSTIGEITERTGFPQSHVSASVARFRERGAVETRVHPEDRRRTLVRLHPQFTRGMDDRAAAPVDSVLARSLGLTDADAARLVRGLEAVAPTVLDAGPLR